MGVKNGKEVLVSSEFNDLVEYTIKVLKNNEFAVRIGESAKKFVKENYDWKNIVSRLDKIYNSVGGTETP